MTLLKPALIALALTTAPALAQTGPNLSGIVAAIEARGYVVRELEVERDRIEISARTPTGARVEIEIDPATGAIRSERPDT